jgi:hypothetical protein
MVVGDNHLCYCKLYVLNFKYSYQQYTDYYSLLRAMYVLLLLSLHRKLKVVQIKTQTIKKLCSYIFSHTPCVEAVSNTSTVTLRVVGGDEKGSLKSETVK